jgi:hypothetical protein
MNHLRTALVTASSAAVIVAGLAVPTMAESVAPPRPAQGTPSPQGPPSSTVTEWAGIALATVYPARSVPDGALYLGFTSLAVYDAVLTARMGPRGHGWISARAAAAVAAHDVLVEYFPTAATTLDAELASTLAGLHHEPAKQRGMVVGAQAADDMIASRVGDGRNNPAITYTKAPAIGIWRPTPPNNAPMALPWLGHVTPLVLDSPTQIKTDGPDALTTSAYAADYNEVRVTGSATATPAERSADQTTTAKFYNANVISQTQTALLGLLAEEPLGIRKTARLFALINASTADGLITTWRLKLDLGYWRPVTAIAQGNDDNNAGTTAVAGWVPLIDTLGGAVPGTPPYPEYPSGHATGTNAFTKALILTMGTAVTDLTLSSPVTSSTKRYTSLHTLSQDAFLARIWLGIHFRDAMDDARFIGEKAARLVDSRLP